jgi:hypothetical protein
MPDTPEAIEPQALDISANRSAAKYTVSEQFGRTLWGLSAPFFRWSPRVLFGWRRMLLRCFRAQVGRDVNIYNSASITIPWNLTIGDWSAVGESALLYNLGKLTIGRNVTISQRAHLCGGTHDYNDPSMPLIRSEIGFATTLGSALTLSSAPASRWEKARCAGPERLSSKTSSPGRSLRGILRE